MWFSSVAGTSAGSITAALIAAGCTPQQMHSLVPRLLASIVPSRVRMILGTKSTLFDGKRLRLELERICANVAGRDADLNNPVTFRELYEASDSPITLYVVALDLSLSAPVVFSVHSTPDVSVSGAVMASSAIPAGFPSVRAIFKNKNDVWVQRLVDGGAWANLPRFIYYDPSFAAWIKRNNPDADLAAEQSRTTVAFALGIDRTTPIRPDTLTLSGRGYPPV